MFLVDCRYEIFLDEIKPNDLSVEFLQEFMELPTSYLAPGAAVKFRKFSSLFPRVVVGLVYNCKMSNKPTF